MSSVRQERKVVTCLFCDLVGFTSQAESMDPEDLASLLDRYHEHLRSELERHGGTVEKFIGDAVMALFGAPAAHEDDPERAVRAALAIRDWARDRDDLQVRLGVTTGEALVRLGVAPGETTATGDVVNTASRLQSAAPENGVLVDDTTYRTTRQAIEYRETEPVEAKGKADPVPAWEAVEARGRFGVDLDQDARTPLVGRSAELETLHGALDRARREHAPQLVTLVGVPGIGKSRLLYELFQLVEREPELITWRQGRSLPYGEGVTFWALAEMVKGQAGILETDSAEEAGSKLEAAIEAAVEDQQDRTWLATHLRPLVGLGGEAGVADRQAEAFAAWRRFIEGLAAQRPAILVFEDLHWADEVLLEFVDYLAEWASGVPLLVVCTARPELLDRRPGWGGGKPNALTISIAPLSEDDTARLVHALLDRAVLPADLQTTLLDRAGGNPLYAEEFARMVDERGLLTDAELPLPESLQGIIAARLDSLSLGDKALVQDAAVIGKVFWPGALAALRAGERWTIEESLHGLERRQLVRRDRRSSVAGETQHAFLHLLVRDVAYGQIPRVQRVEKHRLAAAWIESLATDRSEDHAEMLAHHYLSALELAVAAGVDTSELVPPARTALHEAGDRAASLNAFAAARRFYGAALELLSKDDPDWPYVVFKWAQASSALLEPDVAALEEAIEEFSRLGDVESAADAATFIAVTLNVRGDRAAADDWVGKAITLVEAAPESPAKVRTLAERVRSAMLAGDDEFAIRVGREVLAMAERLGLEDVRAGLLNNIGVSRVNRGDEAGIADLEESVAIALRLGLPQHAHRAYHNLMEVYRIVGRLDKSSEVLAAERESDERFGLVRNLLWVVGEEAFDWYVRGDWEAGRAAACELIREVESGQPHYQEGVARLIRGAIALACGEDAVADADSSRALELGRESKDLQVVGPALALRAFTLLALGRSHEASRLVDEALALPFHYYELIDLAWAVTDLERQEELLSRLSGAARTPWYEAALAIASGDPARAAELFVRMGNVTHETYALLRSGNESRVRRALEFYRSVGATRYIREGEALLAATA